MAAYHKAPRIYLGLAVPAIEALVAEWRAALDLPARVALAADLWGTATCMRAASPRCS